MVEKLANERFNTLLIPAQSVVVEEVYFSQSKTYGITYRMRFSINQPEHKGVIYICKTNSLYKSTYKDQYDKSPPDTIGMLADFFDIKRNEFKDMFKGTDADLKKAEMQELFFLQGERIIKIDSTLIPNATIEVYGVKYENKEIQAELKTNRFHWNNEKRCWSGSMDRSWVSRFHAKYPQLNVGVVLENTKEESTLYKVFNIATERHISVPFADIRNVIVKHFNLSIIKLEASDKLENNSNQPMIIERKEKGIFVWEVIMNTMLIKQETMLGKIKIWSGTNSKSESMKVISEILIGSCQNSLRIATYDRVIHIGDWQSRLIESMVEAKKMLESSVSVIETAMGQSISIEQAYLIVDKNTFGLHDKEKIQKVRDLIKQRIEFEFTKDQTKWSISQAMTNIASHPENYEELNKINLSDSFYERLQTDGYNVLLQTPIINN